MTVDMSGDGLRTWKESCMFVAGRLLDGGNPPPVSTARVDQMLAAASDAGMSEREQGAVLMMLTMAEVTQRSKWRKLPNGKQLAIASAFAMRLLAGQPQQSQR